MEPRRGAGPLNVSIWRIRSPSYLINVSTWTWYKPPVFLRIRMERWCIKHVAYTLKSWLRHEMNTFSGLLALCARNSPVTGEFPLQTPLTRSFGVFFDLRLNKQLSKQPRGWWLETLSRPLWRHCNEIHRRVPNCHVVNDWQRTDAYMFESFYPFVEIWDILNYTCIHPHHVPLMNILAYTDGRQLGLCAEIQP